MAALETVAPGPTSRRIAERSDGPAAGRRSVTPARAVEGGVVAFLLIALVVQLLSYAPNAQQDPDGYVTYARHLLAEGRLLPGYPRQPGYPAVMALMSLALPFSLEEDVYWGQLILMLGFSIVCWAVLRAWFGALTAALFLAILAAPCYLTRMSVSAFPDVPYTFVFLPLLLTILWWTLRPDRTGWRWLLVFGLGLFVASTIRPSTVLAIVALAPAALVGYAAQRWRGWPRPPATQVVARALAVVVISLAVYGLADRLFDTGARRFNASAFAFRVALYLPPAADTRADRRVEAAKARYQRTAGEPIERARLGNYRGFPLLDYVSFDDAEAVWPGRLQAYPLLYLRSIWDDLFLNHYVIARKYTPFGFDLLRMPLYAQPWPKDDGSPASQIFRATGFVVLDHPYLPEHLPLEVELAQAIGRFLITWTLFGVGVWQCWRRQPGLTAATATTLAVFVIAVSATNTMDARYVLPFAPAIYGAQALGLAWGVRAIGGRC